MTLDTRLKRLEASSIPPDEPFQFAVFDHDGTPLNDLARTRSGRTGPGPVSGRSFTFTIDRADDERDRADDASDC
ncbi:MAG TPA: hypothetical protein VIU62_20260 [Chloroflexota bacterium]|nr:hypothetical protein [Arthrobacter sp.]